MATTSTFSALFALVRKDLVLYFSNRRALVMSIAAPIVIAAFFGSLFGSTGGKTTRIPVALADLDGSALSRQVGAGLRDDAALDVRELPAASAVDAVRRGDVRVAIV
ncbi:MAG TPA: ABC transporter, partial [Caldimonas sp.]|nr:ABC transporter [Caldimonas sp.]